LAKELGADVGINALKVDVKEEVLKATGEGCHGVLVTAVSPKALNKRFRLFVVVEPWS
jgi:propanol-preferring alcohol dehydrogenase